MIRSCLVAIGMLVLCGGAYSQTNVRRFTASPYAGANLSVDSALGLGKDKFDFRIVGDYEHQSLVFINQGVPEDILGERLLLDTTLVYGVLPWLDIGLAVPLALGQTGQTLEDGQTLANVALGDPRISIRSHLLSNHTKSLQIAGILETWVPIGDEDAFMAEGGPGFTARLAGDFRVARRTHLSAGLGYHLRPQISLAGLNVDDELQGALAANHIIGNGRFGLSGELRFATDAFAPFETRQRNAGDLNVGGRWNVSGGHQLTIGTGLGILSGIGSPKWRAFVGYGYAGQRTSDRGSAPAEVSPSDDMTTPSTSVAPVVMTQAEPQGKIPTQPMARAHASTGADPDGDGILNATDRCPYLPEDMDGFRDSDGCPEIDNDLDGVLDTADAAPNWAEDWDRHDDTDGVVDPDNDEDGFEDSADNCPFKPGAGDGCPGTPLEWLTLIKRRASTDEQPVRLGQFIFPGKTIVFDTMSQMPSQESKSTIAALADHIKLNPSLIRIEVGVHSKTTKGERHDKWLSAVHAKSTTAALIKHGVDAARLFPFGYGRAIRDDNVSTPTQSFSHVELRALTANETAPKLSQTKPPPNANVPAPTLSPGAVRPPVVKRPKRIRPERPIRFRARKSVLTEQGQHNARQLVAVIQQHPHHRFEVGVHTDGLGSKKAKLTLSQGRAESLRSFLIAAGIKADRLTARGYGSTKPIADDNTMDGRAKNRRVELLMHEATSSALPKEN